MFLQIPENGVFCLYLKKLMMDNGYFTFFIVLALASAALFILSFLVKNNRFFKIFLIIVSVALFIVGLGGCFLMMSVAPGSAYRY